MSELRRRKQSPKKNEKAAAATPEQVSKSDTKKKERKSNGIFSAIVFIIVYVPIVIVINPITIPYLFKKWRYTPCEGICSIGDAPMGDCSPVDSDRLLFLRIPKTATSTVLDIFERGFKRKNVALFDMGELEDVVSSLPREGVNFIKKGFHDPTKYRQRVEWWYKRASKMILVPPYRAQGRSIFEGHWAYFDFTKNALRLLGPEPTYRQFIPDWLQQWYHIKRPESVPEIPIFTFLRHPHDRVKSMYYFDRHEARGIHWRERFVEARGNSTLEECLRNPTCVDANRLQQACSLQVEMLCGIGHSCNPATRESLEIAKLHLDTILFAGITERMEESLHVLQSMLPTYLEGVSLANVPMRKKSTMTRESQFSPEAQAVLDGMCELDVELYQYANELLTKRSKACET